MFTSGTLAIAGDLESLFLKNTIPIRPNRNNKREVGKYRNRTRPLVLKNQKDTIKKSLT